MNLTKERLKELCIEYDNNTGSYPEHEFEGVALYEFICDKLDSRDICPKCGEEVYIEVENIGGQHYGERKYIYTYKHYGLGSCEKEE